MGRIEIKKSKSVHKQTRRTARVMALLSLSQIKGNLKKTENLENDSDKLLLASIRTLSSEVKGAIETASAELNRSNEQIFKSETRSSSLNASIIMLKEAIELTQKAINLLGDTVELPELISLGYQKEVKEYALELIGIVSRRNEEIDDMLNGVMVNWQLSRLPKIDRDILRLATAEMLFLNVDKKVAIDEAVEIAKLYSDQDGYRLINGILRKVVEKITVKVSN